MKQSWMIRQLAAAVAGFAFAAAAPSALAQPADPNVDQSVTAQKEFRTRYQAAVKNADWDGALAVLDEFEKAQPELASQLAGQRFIILLEKKDYDAAYKHAEQTAEKFNDNPQVHNELAWTIVDRPGVEKRDLDLAMKLATRADELTNHGSAEILDTLARVHWEKGDQAKAVELQTTAVEKAEGDLKDELQKVLEKYKAGKK